MRDHGNFDDTWIFETALDHAVDVGAVGAVTMNVGMVRSAAIADLLQTAVSTTRRVTCVPAPPPHAGRKAIVGWALRTDSALAAHASLGAFGENL